MHWPKQYLILNDAWVVKDMVRTFPSKYRCVVWGKESKTQWTLAWLSSHYLQHSPNLPRDALRWNIKGSIEFPTSTNSPYPNMALGNKETNNNNNSVFPHRLECSLGRGKTLPLGWSESCFKVQTLIRAVYFVQTLILSSYFSTSAFRRSKPFILFQGRCSSLFIFVCSFLANNEDRYVVIDTWGNQGLRDEIPVLRLQ